MAQVFVLDGTDLGTSTIRLGQIPGWITRAELGSPGICNVGFDDPAGTLTVTGWKNFTVDESACAVGNQRIFTGYVYDRTYARASADSDILGTSRLISTNFGDQNSALSFRLFPPTDTAANRPAETDVQRLTWLLSTAYAAGVMNYGLVSTTGPVAMDAADLRGQSAMSTLTDCASASGKNFFAYFAETNGGLGLFYDFDYSAVYSSTARFSNVLSDIDSTTTFALDTDWQLTRDPSRVYSGVLVPFSGKTSPVYTQRASTASAFVSRDTTAPNVNTKSKSVATAMGNRYLASISTEDDRISGTVHMPAAHVNDVLAGQRVQVKASHLPGLSTFTYCRVLSREVKQDEPNSDFYNVHYELTPPIQPGAAICAASSPTPNGFYPPNLSATSVSPGYIFYVRPGTPAPTVPTPGFVGAWNFPVFNSGGVDYAGDCVSNSVRIIVIGDGHASIPVLFGGGATGHNWTATVWHNEPSVGDVADLTVTGAVGSSVEVDVSTAGGAWCTHWIDIKEYNPPACGSNWAGFQGFTWAKA